MVALISRLSANGCFQASPRHEQARHRVTPKQVRHPTDCQFTSGCSPPRLAATQLPSISEPRPTPARTCTVLTKRPHGRTHARESGHPWRRASAIWRSGARCARLWIPAFAGMTGGRVEDFRASSLAATVRRLTIRKPLTSSADDDRHAASPRPRRTRRPARCARPRRGRPGVASRALGRTKVVGAHDRGLRPRRPAVSRLPGRAVSGRRPRSPTSSTARRATCAPSSPGAARRGSRVARCSGRFRPFARWPARSRAKPGGPHPRSARSGRRRPRAGCRGR